MHVDVKIPGDVRTHTYHMVLMRPPSTGNQPGGRPPPTNRAGQPGQRGAKNVGNHGHFSSHRIYNGPVFSAVPTRTVFPCENILHLCVVPYRERGVHVRPTSDARGGVVVRHGARARVCRTQRLLARRCGCGFWACGAWRSYLDRTKKGNNENVIRGRRRSLCRPDVHSHG